MAARNYDVMRGCSLSLIYLSYGSCLYVRVSYPVSCLVNLDPWSFIFLLRGAELVDEHVRTQLEAVRREDKGKMDRIRKS